MKERTTTLGSLSAPVALRLAGVLLVGWVVGGLAATSLTRSAEASQHNCPVETFTFTNGNDSRDDLTDGVNENNNWNSQDGADFLRGNPCNDQNINGQGGIDNVGGGAANDTVSGGAQGDAVAGGAGNDTTNGDAGLDDITDTEGSDFDQANGGSDNDDIAVNDNDGQDTANGGAGSDDTCFVDVTPDPDVWTLCENVP